MVKLNKKKGRRSGKRIQYNLARRSLKKKSKKNNKSKKVFMGGFLLPKSNEYDDKATISFDINNCNSKSVKITFKSHDEKKLNSDDSRNFVLLKHRVLDEKTSTPLMKTPLYEAYFKIPKIIFSLCRQKSKGDKKHLKLTVKYDNTGKNNTFDVSHNCTPSKFDSMNNMVKTQVETDATDVKDAFKNALENHTSYNDQISVFLTINGKKLSDKTIEKIKRKYNVKDDEKEEKEQKEQEQEKEQGTHIVKEECDETKQLLKGMTITINPDGSVQFNKSGENTEQDMHKVINDMSEDLNLIKSPEGTVDINTLKHDKLNENAQNKAAVSDDGKNVKENVQEKAEAAVKAAVEEKVEVAAVTNDSKDVEENVQEKAKAAVQAAVSNDSENVEEKVKAAAEAAVQAAVKEAVTNAQD